MDYSRRKLPKTAANKLTGVSLKDVKSFQLLYAPAYLFLEKNQKYISFKGPLDFFSEADLKHAEPFGIVYFPIFLNSLKPLIALAAKVKKVLQKKIELMWQPRGDIPRRIQSTPVPYSVANESLKVLGPFWAERAQGNFGPESYQVCIFINELCDPLPSGDLLALREENVASLEVGVYLSSWVTFFALQLGYLELTFLSELRQEVFKGSLTQSWDLLGGGELADLVTVTQEFLSILSQSGQGAQGEATKFQNGSFFEKRHDALSQKLAARLRRVRREALNVSLLPSVYGEGGLIDD